MTLASNCIPAAMIRGRDLTRMTGAEIDALCGHGSKSAKARCAVKSRPLMNGIEKKYAEYLNELMKKGKVQFWTYEKIRLDLGVSLTYLPDFFVVGENGLAEFHEVKGFWRDDARVKIKAAAEMFPCFTFMAVRLESGSWHYEVFEPYQG